MTKRRRRQYAYAGVALIVLAAAVNLVVWRVRTRVVAPVTYTDTANGIGYAVPAGASVGTTGSGSHITVSSIAIDPTTAQGQDLTQDRISVQQGKVSQIPDQAVTGSLHISQIDGIYTESYVTLTGSSACDVQFTQNVTYYRNNVQYQAHFTGGQTAIVASMPGYFKDNTACPTGKSWNWDADPQAANDFYELLTEGGGRGKAQEWYAGSQTFLKSLSLQ